MSRIAKFFKQPWWETDEITYPDLKKLTRLYFRFYCIRLVSILGLAKPLQSLITKYIFTKMPILTRTYGNKNIKKLRKLKNKHKNKRAFIIAMGPSLKVEDLDQLQEEITLACNKVYLAFDKTTWRPSYYCVTDHLVAKNNAEKIEELPFTKIFRDELIHNFKSPDDIIWTHNLMLLQRTKKHRKTFMHKNVELGTFIGASVVLFKIQLALYMGIKEIYIIGLDFSFQTPNEIPKDKVLKSEGEVNHFHPDYRKAGETWYMPNLDAQYDAFRLIKKYADKHGVKIYNASRKTKLDVFETIDFDSLFPN